MAARRLVVGIVVLMVAIGVFSGFALAQQERNITATLVDTNIEDALRLLFQDTPYSFSVSGDIKGTVTMTLNNVPFQTALDAVLTPLNLTYARQDDVFLIHKAFSVMQPVNGGLGPIDQTVEGTTAKTFRLYQLNFADAYQIARLFGGTGAGMTGGQVGRFGGSGAGFQRGLGGGYGGGGYGGGGYGGGGYPGGGYGGGGYGGGGYGGGGYGTGTGYTGGPGQY